MVIKNPANVIGLVTSRLGDFKRLALEDDGEFRKALTTALMLQECVASMYEMKDWARMVRDGKPKEYCEEYGSIVFERYKEDAVWELEYLEELLSQGSE